MDGTLIDASASMKSFVKIGEASREDGGEDEDGPGGRNRDVDFRGEKRSNGTPGYEVSQRKRKRVEEPFGWMKDIGTIRKLAHRGPEKGATTLLLNVAMFNVTRMKVLT